MLVTNEHPSTNDESAKKFFDPKLLTATDWSTGNLDEMLVSVDQMRSAMLMKENENLKKVEKCLVEKNPDQ